tara:strand:- start:1499 stop:2167 length:669 start_codon:yes stop_codon:yes gene_type:complete
MDLQHPIGLYQNEIYMCNFYDSEYYGLYNCDRILRFFIETLYRGCDLPPYYIGIGMPGPDAKWVYSLNQEKNWKGILIDRINTYAQQGIQDILLKGEITHPSLTDKPFVHLPIFIEQEVTLENIISILENNKVPKKVGYLQIDIDSFDYWLLKHLLDYGIDSPIIRIEYNNDAVGEVEYNPDWYGVSQCSIDMLIDLCLEYGYCYAGHCLQSCDAYLIKRVL